MNRLNIIYPLIFSLAFSSLIKAQPDTMSLSEIFELSDRVFAVTEDITLNEKISHLKGLQLDINHYPAFKVLGQTNYQSDVVSFPFDIPMQTALDLPHIRSQLTFEIEQTILDGGVNNLKKQNNKRSLELAQDRISLRQDARYKQLTELYFRCLLLDNIISTLNNSLQLLREKRSILQSGIKGGVRNESELLEIDSEIIDLRRDSTQRAHQLQSLKAQLGQYLNRSLDHFYFTLPAPDYSPIDSPSSNPTLEIISTKQEQLKLATELSASRKKPKLKAFASTGLGHPNPLNLFDDALSPFFIGGLRFSWPIFDWGRQDKERQIQALHSKLLQNKRQREQVRIRSTLEGFKGEISFLNHALHQDQELIRKRKQIRELKSVQLDKGIIPTDPYLEAVHKEQQAILISHRHKIELAKSKVRYLLENGIDLNQ